MRVSTNLFGKGQRVITDKYRKGYDGIDWGKPKTQKDYEKLGFKVIRRGTRAALRDSEQSCSLCPGGDCSQC